MGICSSSWGLDPERLCRDRVGQWQLYKTQLHSCLPGREASTVDQRRDLQKGKCMGPQTLLRNDAILDFECRTNQVKVSPQVESRDASLGYQTCLRLTLMSVLN